MGFLVFLFYVYLLGCFWCFVLFLRKKAFDLKSLMGWCGAILATICWPLAFLLIAKGVVK